MSDLDVLLARHATTPEDEALMGAIADWLDEHAPDQSELSALYRGGAKKWLTDLAADSGGHGYDTWDYYETDKYVRGDDYRDITYQDVVRAGHDYVDRGDYLIQIGKENLRNKVRGAGREMYWRCWEVVTGRKALAPDKDRGPFSCSC